MSQNISLLTLPVLAVAALTGRRFVTATGSVAAAEGNAIGVARHDASIGEACAVDVVGTAKVEAGGAISAGAAVEVGAGGKAVAVDEGVTVARALEAAGADGDVIEVLLIQQ